MPFYGEVPRSACDPTEPFPFVPEADAESDWGMVMALANEIVRLVDALNYAHSEGFEWPADPLPPGCLANQVLEQRR